ncbi:MAG: hypothetical protein ACLP0J_27120 [Solirubrobacteraceae bacterium]
MSSAGISARGRAELAQVLGSGRRFVAPTDVVEALGVDAGTAAKKLARCVLSDTPGGYGEGIQRHGT